MWKTCVSRLELATSDVSKLTSTFAPSAGWTSAPFASSTLMSKA